jgi:transcriptional regulator with XRE-family HTH domain
MANDDLRAALQAAGLQADDLAEIVQVDVRTVRRWLSGRPPYPRQRGKVARALDTTELDLWPELATAPPTRHPAAQPTDLIAGYTTASDLDAPDWKALMRDSSDQIELLGDTLIPILDTPGVPKLLAAKATRGCEIRILVFQPGPHLAPFLDHPGIDIRVLEAPVHQTIHRYDEQLLVILHVVGEDTEQAPLLHLSRQAAGGLFDRFAEHYNELWEDDSQSIDPDHDLAIHEDEFDDEGEAEDAESEPRPAVAERPSHANSEPEASSPRRWPRRPA